MNFLNFLNGFRKWTIMAAILIASLVFLVTGHLTGAELVDLHKITIPAFMGTNVAEHLIKSTGEWLKGKLKKETT